MRTLLIDNYDSFTFNLFQLIAEVNGEPPVVVRNDQSLEALRGIRFDNVIVSPGPGRPQRHEDIGISHRFLMSGNVPVLGVCLGHQALAHLHGAHVDHAPEVMHGRLSRIFHDGTRLFEDIPQAFRATRYHSFAVNEPLPAWLRKTAWSEDRVVMGLCHSELPLWGVQFHPESICTDYGRQLVANFRRLTVDFWAGRNTERGEHDDDFRSLSVVPVGLERRPLRDAGYEVRARPLALAPDVEDTFTHLYGDEPTAFWLDSSRAEPGLSRFSFMGAADGPNGFVVSYDLGAHRLTIAKDGATQERAEGIFDFLRRELDRHHVQSPALPFDFNSGFVGYFGYELKAQCGGDEGFPASQPDARFIFADRMIVVDHLEKITYLVHLAKKDDGAEAEKWFDAMEGRLRSLPRAPTPARGDGRQRADFRLHRNRTQYLGDIAECMRQIHDGETYEVCLTNRLRAEVRLDALALYRALRHRNPAPYSAFLRFGDMAVVCSSPERFLRIDSKGRVETKPIKGTSRRGETPEEDAALREQLRSSEKDRSENLMVVDLLRNDLGLVCEVGSVEVPKLMDVETYATVHQLVSTVSGTLRKDMRAIDCVRAAFPGGSMTGAPKLRTMKIIDRLEQEPRGIYSGSIGYLALNGAADLNIVIRTAVVTKDDISIGIGGAVVALSDPEAEFDELLLKSAPLVDAANWLRGVPGYWNE